VVATAKLADTSFVLLDYPFFALCNLPTCGTHRMRYLREWAIVREHLDERGAFLVVRRIAGS